MPGGRHPCPAACTEGLSERVPAPYRRGPTSPRAEGNPSPCAERSGQSSAEPVDTVRQAFDCGGGCDFSWPGSIRLITNRIEDFVPHCLGSVGNRAVIGTPIRHLIASGSPPCHSPTERTAGLAIGEWQRQPQLRGYTTHLSTAGGVPCAEAFITPGEPLRARQR